MKAAGNLVRRRTGAHAYASAATVAGTAPRGSASTSIGNHLAKGVGATSTLRQGAQAATEAMRPRDAVWHWLATKLATDQFLTYAFAGTPRSVGDAVDEVIRRARDCEDFGLRIRRRNLDLRFPEWVSGTPVEGEQVRVHPITALTWQGVLDEVARMWARQLDPARAAWRLHVFTDVSDVPGSVGPSTVVILQVSHVLGDGTRTAALAGRLFGRSAGPVPVVRSDGGRRLGRVVDAYRARQQLRRDVEAGSVPPAKEPVPALSTNRRPAGPSVLRTVTRRPDELPGPTVLVGALVAVSEALSGYLRGRGEDVAALTADVAIARPGQPRARNHFATYPIGLYPDAPKQDQYRRIVGDLMAVHRRNSHPAFAADAFDAVPAVVRRAAILRLKAADEPSTVQANTVISSVDRGAADLTFGGCPVILTSSYPSLLPDIGLTHGVHRIGDTVAVSVHTTASVIPDIDEYLDRLNHALRA